MPNTLSSIMESLQTMAEQKGVIDPGTYLLAAEKINALLQNEESELYIMEQRVAQMRVDLLNEGKTATHAKLVVEASDEYRITRDKKSLITRALQTVMLAKTHARLSSDMARAGM